MQKYRIVSLSVFGLICLSGIVYALMPGLFPDTEEFPRIPMGEGTIGGVIAKILQITDLENYLGDGSVPNSARLDGNSATGYLKIQLFPCVNPTDKWVGLDADGDPVCGSTTPAPSDYGSIVTQDCSGNIYYGSGTSDSTATGQNIQAGDIIQTAPGCTMTITFSDYSIIRLDGDTVVAFDLGYLPDSTTIATALLENGSLWGRILTETGSYSVGTREIIAGVRGTSIALVSTGRTVGPITYSGTGWIVPTSANTEPTTLAIVDTISNTGAAKVYCGNLALPDLPREGSYIIPPGGCIVPPIPTAVVLPPVNLPASTLFATSPWILQNTAKDIEYMYDILAITGATLSPAKINILSGELATTVPPRSNTGELTTTGTTEASLLCAASGKRWWNDRFLCQDNSILAIADYTRPDSTCSAMANIGAIYFYTGGRVEYICPKSINGVSNIPGIGVLIGGGVGPKIEYATNAGEVGVINSYLSGGIINRKFRFHLSNPSPMSAVTEYGVIALNGTKKFSFYGPASYRANLSTKAFGIGLGDGYTISYTSLSGQYLISSIPDFFRIGTDPAITNGLNATIKKVEILE